MNFLIKYLLIILLFDFDPYALWSVQCTQQVKNIYINGLSSHLSPWKDRYVSNIKGHANFFLDKSPDLQMHCGYKTKLNMYVFRIKLPFYQYSPYLN